MENKKDILNDFLGLIVEEKVFGGQTIHAFGTDVHDIAGKTIGILEVKNLLFCNIGDRPPFSDTVDIESPCLIVQELDETLSDENNKVLVPTDGIKLTNDQAKFIMKYLRGGK